MRSQIHLKTILVTGGVVGAASSAALAHGEGDIGLLFDGVNIVTAVANDATGEFADFGERVFAAEMAMGVGDEPGFFTTDGATNTVGAFGVGTTIGYETQAALRMWDGTDFDDIAGVSLIQDFGGSQISTPGSDTPTAGFDFLYSGGDFDEHPDYGLSSDVAGIYLWEITFTATDAAGGFLGTTDSLFVVFNNGLSEEMHEEALEYVENVILPAPGAATLLGAAGLFAARRRRV